MMSMRRTLLGFSALLAAFALLVPVAGLAQTGTTDTTDPSMVPDARTKVDNVRVLPFADRFDALQVAWVEPIPGTENEEVSDEEGPLNGYRIYYREMVAAENTTLNAADLLNAHTKDVGVGVSGTIDGLKPGKTYLVRVAPKNKIGVGTIDDAADAATGTVTPAAKPDRVTGVTVTPGDGMLMIEWIEPYAGHSTLTIKAYHVWVRTSKTDTADAGTWRDVGPVTTTSAIASNLTNGMSYDVEVNAKNSADVQGDRSVPVMATPSADAAGTGGGDGEETPMETPALPLVGVLLLGTGLVAAGRRRLRQ